MLISDWSSDVCSSDLIARVKRGGKRFRLCRRTSTDQNANGLVPCQAARDIAAEIAIAANDEHARYHVGLVTMSQKMMIRPPKAGQPSATTADRKSTRLNSSH